MEESRRKTAAAVAAAAAVERAAARGQQWGATMRGWGPEGRVGRGIEGMNDLTRTSETPVVLCGGKSPCMVDVQFCK
eukprot:1160709-Pelagomonas_calceolata.AAC.2